LAGLSRATTPQPQELLSTQKFFARENLANGRPDNSNWSEAN